MARMTGPLLSLEARGMIAGRYIYQQAMGRQVMRYHWQQGQHTTIEQAPYQQAHGLLSHLISWIKAGRPHLNSSGLDDYLMLREIAGRRDRWNDMVRRRMLKHGHANISHVLALWAGLDETDREAWGNVASGVAPTLTEYTGKAPPGIEPPTWPAGALFFVYHWLAYLVGLIQDEPGATP